MSFLSRGFVFVAFVLLLLLYLLPSFTRAASVGILTPIPDNRQISPPVVSSTPRPHTDDTLQAGHDIYIQDIALRGLHYFHASQVFRILGLSTAHHYSKSELEAAVRHLTNSGLFATVSFTYESKGVLVITLKEQPILSTVEITGNHLLTKEKILGLLKEVDIQEGYLFQRGAMETIREQLVAGYESAGEYNISIDYETKEVDDNSIKLTIKIYEARSALVQEIRFVGNHFFSDKALRDIIELRGPIVRLWGYQGSRYTAAALDGDISRLTSTYHDKGFLDFEVTGHQVAFSRDRDYLYITIALQEGVHYKVASNQLGGDTIIPRSEAASILFTPVNQYYSQSTIDKRIGKLESALKDIGYLDAKVDLRTETHPEKAAADLTYVVSPGYQKYVRRVLIKGNRFTADEVIRREIRQTEGAVASQKLIDISKVRINRLGHFKNVNVSVKPVPGTKDMVDVVFEVEESPRFNIQARLEYSSRYHWGVSFGYGQKNILGSGYDFNIDAKYQEERQSASLGFYDPALFDTSLTAYYSLSLSREKSGKQKYYNYDLSTRVGYPVTENSSIRYHLAWNYTHTVRPKDKYLTLDVKKYIDAKGVTYKDYVGGISLFTNTLNYGFMPTKGISQEIAYYISAPFGTNSFYTVDYSFDGYLPLTPNESFVLHLELDADYARTYGKSKGLYPYYRNHYLGGIYDMIGFSDQSIGPDSYYADDLSVAGKVGGNIRFVQTSSLILPKLPNQPNFRSSIFVQSGALYNNQCLVKYGSCDNSISTRDVRMSAGIRATWVTPIAPISISLAQPIRYKKGDDVELVQFAVGFSFQ